jgi:hypothetical protein
MIERVRRAEEGVGVSQFARREARLKSGFAHVYPALEVGKWEPAGILADEVTAWLLRQAHGGFICPDRVLQPEHFEFRETPSPGFATKPYQT